MEENQFNIVVGQSGGPTTVINASLYGVVREAQKSPQIQHIYGMINGIQGFIDDRMMDIEQELGDSLEMLKNTPAAYLGSCRYKLPEDLSDGIYSIIFHKFQIHNIKCFIYIGGNDSMDTVSKLAAYAGRVASDIKIIGVPKTIDNDLILTDHSPGFGSAAKYVATTVRDIVLDANVYHTHSVTIIELMGRHAGWITASSVLARKYKGDNPVLIYLPEVPFDVEQFVRDVETQLIEVNNVIVCVSEGIKDKEGTFICEYAGAAGTDTFGHKMLTGCAKYLENVIKDRLGVKCRSVELNVTQRCKAILASATDIEEAVMAGAYGVKAFIRGETGKMVAFVRKNDNGYSSVCETVDCSLVCNQEKVVPREWISEDGTDILEAFIEYAMPLIQGESRPKMQDGLPVYCYRR